MALYSRSKHKTKITTWWRFWPRSCRSAVLEVNKLLFLVDKFRNFLMNFTILSFVSNYVIFSHDFWSFSVMIFSHDFWSIFGHFCPFHHFFVYFLSFFVLIQCVRARLSLLMYYKQYYEATISLERPVIGIWKLTCGQQ